MPALAICVYVSRDIPGSLRARNKTKENAFRGRWRTNAIAADELSSSPSAAFESSSASSSSAYLLDFRPLGALVGVAGTAFLAWLECQNLVVRGLSV